MRSACTLIVLSLFFVVWSGPAAVASSAPRFQFWSASRFSQADCALSVSPGHTTVTTPFVTCSGLWDELIVSWNAAAPRSATMDVTVRAEQAGHRTRWYSLGHWAATAGRSARTSLHGQHDSDGEVKTDTLILKHPAQRFPIRVVMHSPLRLLFLGACLTNRHSVSVRRTPNRRAWGKELPVPRFSQLSCSKGKGWCSPASVAMVLSYWARQNGRPDWSRDIAQCAAGVYDKGRDGTGNWSFNVAYAGALPGLRAYVSRLDDTRALEDWIAAGVPVVLAVSVDLRSGDDRPGHAGHLIVCTGFTQSGDLVGNDPWTHLGRGEKISRIIPRSRLSAIWESSEHTVYLIHPDTIHPPQENTVS